MKRYIIGLAIGIIMVLLALLIIVYFGKYEHTSFLIISGLCGFSSQLLSHEILN